MDKVFGDDNIDNRYVLFYRAWLAFFSHPADFTPVCTTELARLHQIAGEFTKRNCKLIAYSCDALATHHTWSKVCRPGDYSIINLVTSKLEMYRFA